MARAAASYLLSFLGGCVLTVIVVAGAGHAPWPGAWTLDTHANANALLEWASTLSPVAAGSVILGLLAGVLLVVYWRDAAALLGRLLGRPGLAKMGAASATAARPAAGQADLGAVRSELERQLGRLIVLIAGHLENSKEHVASLKDTNEHLASVTTVSELRDVVQTLILNNEANERQTRALEARLKEAQDQATVLRQRLNQAEKLASLDPLTSVANRRRFEQFIETSITGSHENGTPLCLIMTDIDRFKRVNDTYGHAAGDRVLKSFAALLSKSVRGTDLVARYGGEEFAIVLPMTPMGNAFGIAERIRNRFELDGGVDGKTASEFGRLTASFGIAEIREGEPAEELIRRADQMLYEAKSNGRNRTVIWSSSTEDAPLAEQRAAS
jgi:diguanylate cyclase